MYLGCIHDWHINIFGLYGKWQLRTGENECIFIFIINVFICQCNHFLIITWNYYAILLIGVYQFS